VIEETSGHARTFARKFCVSGRFLDLSRRNARTFLLSGWPKIRPPPELLPEGLNNPGDGPCRCVLRRRRRGGGDPSAVTLNSCERQWCNQCLDGSIFRPGLRSRPGLETANDAPARNRHLRPGCAIAATSTVNTLLASASSEQCALTDCVTSLRVAITVAHQPAREDRPTLCTQLYAFWQSVTAVQC
jgi:hypothetical protein